MGTQSRLITRSGIALAITSGLLISSGLTPARHVGAAASTIYVTTLSDTNVEDLWRNTLIPDFVKAYPQYAGKINYVNILHGTNSQSLIVDKMTAAMNAGRKTYNLDLLDDTPLSYNYPTGKTYKDYFLPLNVQNVPNAAKIDASTLHTTTGYEMPYRASAVVLAYNSQQVSAPPKTFADLIAWIKAHPGKFTYCPPDQGGSGGAFVQAALRTTMSPAAFKNPYDKKYEANWSKGWALLKSIEPDLFQNGFHPKGNVPVLNLLAKGTTWMATAWSDQALSALDKGLLPSYIKLTQITPPFDGGPATMSIPKMAQNAAGGKLLLNFILTPAEQGKIGVAMEGFPAINPKYVSSSVLKHFGSIVAGYNFFPSGYGDDITAGWKANVPAAQ